MVKKAGLRSGYTTGVCAAAAAKAAALMLLGRQPLEQIKLITPNGVEVELAVHDPRWDGQSASCAVQKDSGDDPDVTNGLLIYAYVQKAGHGAIAVDGGKGVGRVTKPGLACAIGEAAINPVPRRMIAAEVEAVSRAYDWTDGLDVIIAVPEGEEIARKTFNPRLGIVGGISILGTTGIVEPMSEKAWTDSLYLEMKQHYELGNRNLLICPGNYGLRFMEENLGLDMVKAIKCSNFIGEALDYARDLNFESLLLIGHAGKLVKLGAGVMNTHSKYADARMEVLAVHAALNGASRTIVAAIMDCNTTEEAAAVLAQHHLDKPVFRDIMNKIDDYVQKRVDGRLQTAVIMFSNEFGMMGKTSRADELMNWHRQTVADSDID